MNSYKKFSSEQNLILEEFIKKFVNYPTKSAIKEIANTLETSVNKIENWLKYYRRKLYFNGKLGDYKVRKLFSPKKIAYLNEKFQENKNPDFLECESISKELGENTTAFQIKNWFANQRRKTKSNLGIKKTQENIFSSDEKEVKEVPKKKSREKKERGTSCQEQNLT